MANFKKRALSLFVALVMVISMMPMNAFAAEEYHIHDTITLNAGDENLPELAEGLAWQKQGEVFTEHDHTNDVECETCKGDGLVDHDYDVVVTDPTCTEDGYTTYTCKNNAAHSYVVTDEGSALDHSFTNYVSDGNATCTEDGTKTAQCDRCEATDTIDDEGSALDHSFTNYVSDGNATCTEDGTKTAQCDRCEATDTIDDEGSALDHSFTNYVSDGNATCTEDGTKTAQCDRCEATDTIGDEGSALDHSFTNYVSDGNATCTEDGTKTAQCDRCEATDTIGDEGSALDHSFTNYVSDGNATCTEDGTKTAQCDRCEATDTIDDEGSALDHSFTNYVSDGNATCTEDGTKTAQCDRCEATDTIDDEGSALDHSFTNYVSDGNATCTEDGTKTAQCDRCEATDTIDDEGSALDHSFTNYVSDGNATCTEDGTKTAQCDRCEATDTIDDEGSALDHSFTNYVSDGNATCTEDGTKTAQCDRCEATDTIDDEGSALDHSFTNYVSDGNATCTEDGTKTAQCDRCEATDTIDDEGSALDHSFTNYVSDGNATCTEDGTKTATCDREGCGETNTVTDTGSKLGHSYTNYVSDGNATCTEDGTKTATCDREGCGETNTVTDTGSKLGHSYTNYVSDGNATCTEDGTKTATCDREGCGETNTVTDTGSKLGHSYTNYVSDGNATCTEDGTKTATCDREGCGETNTVTDTGSKGHSYSPVTTNPTCTNPGYTQYTCTCGATWGWKYDYKLPMGHSFSDWTTVTAATCTEKGSERRECDNCDHYETRQTNKLNHNYTSVVSHTKQGHSYECSCGDIAEVPHSYNGIFDPICDTCGHDRYQNPSNWCDACDHPGQGMGPASLSVERTSMSGVDFCHECDEENCNDGIIHVCVNSCQKQTWTVVEAYHVYGEWITTSAATFYAVGSERRDCANCDHYETREIPMLNIIYSPTIDITEPEVPMGSGDDTTTIEDEETPLAAGELLNVDEFFAYINGYGEEVRPDNNITRAEFVTIIFRLLNDDVRLESWGTESRFADVTDPEAWYYNEVVTCDNLGILDYYEDNFEPNKAITRAEVAYIVAMFTGDAYEGEENLFTDIADSFAADAINDIATLGIIGGVGDNKFDPEANITRAAVTKMINLLLGRDAEKLEGDLMNWVDNADENKWYFDYIRVASNSFDAETFQVTDEKKDWTALEQKWAEEYVAMIAEGEDEAEAEDAE